MTALALLAGCALPTSFQAPEEPKDEPTAASRLGPGCQDTTFGEAKEGAFEVVVLADERTLGAKLPPAQLWPASLAELLGFGEEKPVVVHMVGCPDWTATEGAAWLSEQKAPPSLVLNALTGTPRGALAAAPQIRLPESTEPPEPAATPKPDGDAPPTEPLPPEPTGQVVDVGERWRRTREPGLFASQRAAQMTATGHTRIAQQVASELRSMFPAGSGSPFIGGPPPAPTATTTRLAWITTDPIADCLAHAILDRTGAAQGLTLEAHPEASAPRLLDDVHLGAVDVMLIPQDLAQQLPPAAYHWEDRGRVTGGAATLLLRSSVEWRTTVDAIDTRPDWNTDTAMTTALEGAAGSCPGATAKTSVPPPGY